MLIKPDHYPEVHWLPSLLPLTLLSLKVFITISCPNTKCGLHFLQTTRWQSSNWSQIVPCLFHRCKYQTLMGVCVKLLCVHQKCQDFFEGWYWLNCLQWSVSFSLPGHLCLSAALYFMKSTQNIVLLKSQHRGEREGFNNTCMPSKPFPLSKQSLHSLCAHLDPSGSLLALIDYLKC